VPATLAPIGPVTLEGRYISLEPLAERHAPDIFEAMQDEDVCRYLSWPPPKAIDETLALIRQAEEVMARRESVVFAQIWKATGRDRLHAPSRRAPGRPSGGDRRDISRPRVLAHACQYRVEVPLLALLLRNPGLHTRRAQDRRPQHPLPGSDHPTRRGSRGHAP